MAGLILGAAALSFGIEPFTALGGALYLQDPIMIEFEIAARTDQPQKN